MAKGVRSSMLMKVGRLPVEYPLGCRHYQADFADRLSHLKSSHEADNGADITLDHLAL